MKRFLLVLVTLLVLCSSPGSAETINGIDIGESLTPLPMKQGVTLHATYEIISIEPWDYYIASEMEYDGQAFSGVIRENHVGDREILFSFAQSEESIHDWHDISYVEGSYEQSDGKYLYFTLWNSFNWHHSLYRFNLETECFDRVLDEPCSNMVLFEDPTEEMKGLGWILYDEYIVAIDLSESAYDEDLSTSIEQLGGLPDISEHFFFGIGSWGDRKYAMIEPISDGVLGIHAALFNTETPEQPEKANDYKYDCLNKKIEVNRMIN